MITCVMACVCCSRVQMGCLDWGDIKASWEAQFELPGCTGGQEIAGRHILIHNTVIPLHIHIKQTRTHSWGLHKQCFFTFTSLSRRSYPERHSRKRTIFVYFFVLVPHGNRTHNPANWSAKLYHLSHMGPHYAQNWGAIPQSWCSW